MEKSALQWLYYSQFPFKIWVLYDAYSHGRLKAVAIEGDYEHKYSLTK